ncbi:MAG: hypothetical protein ACREPI_06515, partial [Candidatus Dormibacterales bacterium]
PKTPTEINHPTKVRTQPAAKSANGRAGRFTTLVNGDVGAGKDVAVSLTSSAPILAERPLYFHACPGGVCADGADVALGAAPAQSRYFAEGYTGSGFQEYLTLENPGSTPGTATVTYLFTDSTGTARAVPVPGLARVTLDVNAAVGPGRQVSAEISSTVALVAERPIYFNACPGSVCMNGGSVSSGATSIP